MLCSSSKITHLHIAKKEAFNWPPETPMWNPALQNWNKIQLNRNHQNPSVTSLLLPPKNHPTQKPKNQKLQKQQQNPNHNRASYSREENDGNKSWLIHYLTLGLSAHSLNKRDFCYSIILIIESVILGQLSLYSKLVVPLAPRILATYSCNVQLSYRKQKLLNYPIYFDSALSAQTHYRKSTDLVWVPMKDLGQGSWVCLNSI